MITKFKFIFFNLYVIFFTCKILAMEKPKASDAVALTEAIKDLSLKTFPRPSPKPRPPAKAGHHVITKIDQTKCPLKHSPKSLTILGTLKQCQCQIVEYQPALSPKKFPKDEDETYDEQCRTQ